MTEDRLRGIFAGEYRHYDVYVNHKDKPRKYFVKDVEVQDAGVNRTDKAIIAKANKLGIKFNQKGLSN